MNYSANAIRWNIGDLVLHDCDAKRADMLMRVVKYLPNSKVRAEYLDGKLRIRQTLRSRGSDSWFDLADLHDPARFGVVTTDRRPQ